MKNLLKFAPTIACAIPIATIWLINFVFILIWDRMQSYQFAIMVTGVFAFGGSIKLAFEIYEFLKNR